MEILVWGLWLAGAYLIGSVPFGYLIGKARGVDVRTVGSKNIGATNVYRTVGKKWGFLAFFCDFLKGCLPTLAATAYVSARGDGGSLANLPILVGLFCVIGHTLTVFMHFKGGKGVATAFGMLIALLPVPTLAAFGLFVITVWLSHYISLGSMLAAASLGVAVWFYPCLPLLRIIMTLLAAFVIWKHRTNIVRLAHGCENKIY